MKFIIVLGLILSSNVYSSGKLPTVQEYEAIASLVLSDKSLAPLIYSIESGKLDPMYHWQGGVVASKNLSNIFNSLIINRLDYTKGYVGNLDESLSLLKLLIKKGVDINAKQPLNQPSSEPDDKNPIFYASKGCSVEVFLLLQDNYLNDELEPDAWLEASLGARKEGVSQEQISKCLLISEFLLKRQKSLRSFTIYSLLAGPNSNIALTFGDTINEIFPSENLQNIFYENFGVKFNKMPQGSIPTDKWYEEFKLHFARPLNNIIGSREPETYAKAWWSAQSNIMKAWACYYSSFDEVMALLLQNGTSKDWLINSTKGELTIFRGYGNFAMNEFKPYCEQLKK